MYEISLVPDVKSELIKKLKLRNFVFLVCLIVAASCGGVFLILFGITGGQGLTLKAQDKEMACRSDGILKDKNDRCDSSYGTAIMKFENEKELLTIQDQMKNLSYLNGSKIKISRVFNIMDTILPRMDRGDDNTIQINKLTTDISNNTLFFEAMGYSSNNIGYRALEAFKKNAARAYYDYGSYMRQDYETGDFVAIPSFCITEERDKAGILYGIYHKGMPGCEAPMVEKEEDETVDSEEEDEDVAEDEEETEAGETKKNEIQDIRIRRTYNDSSDRDDYKNGNDRYAAEGAEKIKGYYFESKCLQYDDKGKFDEPSTLSTCPLLMEDPAISNSSYGRDNDERMVLTFSASLNISKDVFLSSNKHMVVVGPTRQNVTDSYIQIRGMFAQAAHDTEEK